ncbi:hypothetical protein [Arthrobacter pityocampae]|uniref:hypothetical protein n=1 Tax=Arthrobacter pityocampae TaxID=547334 RepID=UPI003736BC6B
MADDPASVRDREPRAFRATAFCRTSRWRHRRERAFRYDVLWDDGTVDQDIDLVKVMYRGSPADFQVTEAGMMRHTPYVGTGPWIADSYGMPVDGPDWIRFMAEEREKHARAMEPVAVRATRVTRQHRTRVLRTTVSQS